MLSLLLIVIGSEVIVPCTFSFLAEAAKSCGQLQLPHNPVHMRACADSQTYVIFLCNSVIPRDERLATTRQLRTNFECSWRPSYPRDIHQMSVIPDFFVASVFRSRLYTLTLIMIIPSFTHCALAYPLLCRVKDVPCTAWSAHIVYV